MDMLSSIDMSSSDEENCLYRLCLGDSLDDFLELFVTAGGEEPAHKKLRGPDSEVFVRRDSSPTSLSSTSQDSASSNESLDADNPTMLKVRQDQEAVAMLASQLTCAFHRSVTQMLLGERKGPLKDIVAEVMRG
jgi:hypothetical protein